MQIIRQYAIPRNGIVTVEVPKAFDGQQVEVQLILAQEVALIPPKNSHKQDNVTTGLGALVGKYKHYSQQQNDLIDRELTTIRDEWERSI